MAPISFDFNVVQGARVTVTYDDTSRAVEAMSLNNEQPASPDILAVLDLTWSTVPQIVEHFEVPAGRSISISVPADMFLPADDDENGVMPFDSTLRAMRVAG